MSKVPRVTVVMTAYNRDRYVDTAITSVLQQTFTDFEFVIVDDGSTDGTAEIIRRHAECDSRIRVVTQANQGIAKAANAGCREARGEFIARFDSDDICMPDRLMRQVAFLDANPHYAVVSGSGAMLADTGLTGHEFRLGPSLQPLSRILDETSCIVQPAAMMRRHVFEACGPYRQCVAPAEDYDLWLRIADSFELVNLDGPPLIQYRIHPGQASATQLRRQALSMLAARAASRLRRAAGSDPLAGVEELTPAVFARMGISDEAAEASVVECTLCRLISSVPAATGRECDETEKYLRAIRQTSLRPKHASLRRLVDTLENELVVRRIRLGLASGNLHHAVFAAITTTVSRPSLIARMIRRLVRHKATR